MLYIYSENTVKEPSLNFLRSYDCAS